MCLHSPSDPGGTNSNVTLQDVLFLCSDPSGNCCEHDVLPTSTLQAQIQKLRNDISIANASNNVLQAKLQHLRDRMAHTVALREKATALRSQQPVAVLPCSNVSASMQHDNWKIIPPDKNRIQSKTVWTNI